MERGPRSDSSGEGAVRGRRGLMWRRAFAWHGFPVTVLVAALVAGSALLRPEFLSSGSVAGFLAAYVPVAYTAVGESFAMFVGGIDLSVGSIVSLVNVLTTVLVGAGWDFLGVGPRGGLYVCATPGACAAGWGFVPAAIGATAAGTAIGLLNGLVIAGLRINPLLATLATGFVAGGAALYLLPLPGGEMPGNVVSWFAQGGIMPKPAWFLVLAVVAALLIVRTPLGVEMRATGASEWRAYATGIRTRRAQLIGYLLSSFFASVGGVLLTLNIAAGDPLVGTSFTLNAIAAAVLGGASLAGGRAEPIGPVFGAFLLGFVVTMVLALGIPPYYQILASGLVIVVGLAGIKLLGMAGG
jgi:ribose transport system permease protein